MTNTAPSPHATRVPTTARRGLIWTLAALAVVHSILLMIWVMPDNPLRAAIGTDRLRSYINPYFEQSWSIFAPTPLRGDENVQIRAYVGDYKARTGKATDWYDITAKEDERIKSLPNPFRDAAAWGRHELVAARSQQGSAASCPGQRHRIAAN